MTVVTYKIVELHYIFKEHAQTMSSLNKNDTSSLNDFDTLDMCIIYYLL